MTKQPALSTLKRKRIISAERTKVPLQAVSFRMPKEEFASLTELASDLHLSKSELILKGLRRCMKDEVWQISTLAQKSKADDEVSPPPDVVTVSQALMGVCMALEDIVAHPRRRPSNLKEAQATLVDARRMMVQLLKDHGCC